MGLVRKHFAGGAAARAVIGLLLAAAAGLGAGTGVVHARDTANLAAADATPPVALASLPREARHTHRLVLQGGPFPYGKDGSVFGNRERLLPRQPRGYWREYTVPTPGSRDRGARRLVCGGAPTNPAACYYTADHYASFRRIAP